MFINFILNGNLNIIRIIIRIIFMYLTITYNLIEIRI